MLDVEPIIKENNGFFVGGYAMSAISLVDTNERLATFIKKIDGLSVLPHVVFKVLEVSSSTDNPAGDVEKAIVVDPGFSSKVLVLANSASFGLPKRVTSIKDAVMFLGFKTVRNLAMTVGTFDLFVGKNDRESLRRRSWWRQSIDTAVLCKWLASEYGSFPSDEAYTCGLLHLIGKTLLDRYGEEQYEGVSEREELGISDFEAENDVYGCNHVEVAIAATRKWGLPTSMQSSLNYLQEPDPQDEAAMHRACLAAAVHLALLVKNLHSEMPVWAFDRMNLSKEPIEELVQKASRKVADSQFQM